MKLGDLKNKDYFRNLNKKFSSFFAERAGLILGFIFVVSVCYCLYLLYKHIYHPQWSEGKKMEYLNSKGAETSFNENKFNRIVSMEDERKKRREEKIEDVRDIFKLK